MSLVQTVRSRRIAVIAASAALVLTGSLLSAPSSSADDSSTLTVVGTSDVFDSNLVTSVLKPGFEAAHPGVTLNYVSKGTGAAIAYAEAGTASALLVHAASLENQFVAGGYSLESYGRAIFWGDYVLLGPNSDPVGVMTSDQHDIVGAFEKIAAAGANGTANFVSRGGTPGTTVQEHAIWSRTSTTIPQCTVSDANGGGTSPSTTTGACPTNISYPSWYHATGLTQGPNIINADTCNYSGGNCYVLTDRGTYQYLVSQNEISNLKIVTRDNDTAAPGGGTLLVNSFHAYAINPGKFSDDPNVHINSTAAVQFLDWVTSPAGQTAVGNYLNAGNDPPFIPDAAPTLTAAALPASVTGGASMKIHGSLTNVVPGTPPLENQPVYLTRTPTDTSLPSITAATAFTDADGKYSFTYSPSVNATYSLATRQISQVEDSTLDPIFGDLLAPSQKALSTVHVVGLAKVTSSTGKKGAYAVAGDLLPTVKKSGGYLVLWSANLTKHQSLHYVHRWPLYAGRSTYSFSYAVPKGQYQYFLKYENPGVVDTGATTMRKVNVT